MRETGKAVNRRKQELLSHFRKGEILEAARRVFGRKGFEAALVEDIAAEAGIAKGTVYLYFPSKADIYRAAFQEDLQALATLKRERVAAVSGAREKLRAYVEATVDYCERRRDFFRIFLVESGRLMCSSIHTPGEMHEIARQQVNILQTMLEAAVAEGEVRKLNPESAAWVIGTAIKGLIERRVMADSHWDAAADAELIVDLLWNGLAPKSPARPAPRAPKKRR